MALYTLAGISGLVTFLLPAQRLAPRVEPTLKHNLLAISMKR
jgi:hypothetical protein